MVSFTRILITWHLFFDKIRLKLNNMFLVAHDTNNFIMTSSEICQPICNVTKWVTLALYWLHFRFEFQENLLLLLFAACCNCTILDCIYLRRFTHLFDETGLNWGCALCIYLIALASLRLRNWISMNDAMLWDIARQLIANHYCLENYRRFAFWPRHSINSIRFMCEVTCTYCSY